MVVKSVKSHSLKALRKVFKNLSFQLINLSFRVDVSCRYNFLLQTHEKKCSENPEHFLFFTSRHRRHRRRHHRKSLHQKIRWN